MEKDYKILRRLITQGCKLYDPYIRLRLTNAGLLLLALLIAPLVPKAQQLPQFGQYYMNPYLYNPALVGNKGQTRAFFSYRKQWVGIKGAPESQVFTIDGALKDEKIGFGLSFVNDVTNILGKVSVSATGGYAVNLTEHRQLRFGMSASIIQNKIFFDRVQAFDDGDPAVLEEIDNRSVFEANAGLFYQSKKLGIGLAADQLLQNTVTHENPSDFRTLDFNLVTHYALTAEYEFDLNPSLKLRPFAMLRTAQGLSAQFDLNAILTYRDFLWGNLAYKHKVGVAMAVGVTLSEKLMIGYSYEHATTGLNLANQGSHDFTVGIYLGSIGGGRRSSRYTATSSQDLEKTKRDNALQYEKLDALEQSNQKLKEELAAHKKAVKEKLEELERLKKISDTYSRDLEQVIKEEGVDDDEETFDEDADYYLIVGAFRKLENAKTYQKIMQREVQLSTRVIQNQRKSWYLIYTEELGSIEESKEKIKALGQGVARPYIIGKPWVYKRRKK